MKRLTVAAAALAAGLFTVVAHSQAESDRFLSRWSSEATKPEKAERNVEADKKSKVKTASAQSRKGKGRTKIIFETQTVDAQTTGSVSRVQPELKAIARKSIFGLANNTAEKTGKVANATTSYTTLVSLYASTYGVPVSLAHAVITVESNYRADARGSAGEVGLMQIKPSTARMMGYSGGVKGLFDPETNIKYGMKYLAMAHQLAGGNTCGTILRYNAGHGAKRMNPVSAAYCSKVKQLL